MAVFRPFDRVSDALRRLWSAPARKPTPAASYPDVIVHDPAAQRPHDLDDPFFDAGVQTRMADVIASARQKKE